MTLRPRFLVLTLLLSGCGPRPEPASRVVTPTGPSAPAEASPAASTPTRIETH